jgi:molecular chaperone DnaK (HSP70)
MDYPQAGIRDSQIEIAEATVKPIFEHQTQSLIELIEEQLQDLQRKRPDEKVSYLVLSGGLCASEYVQSKVKAHFGAGAGAVIPNARNMKMLLAENM